MEGSLYVALFFYPGKSIQAALADKFRKLKRI